MNHNPFDIVENGGFMGSQVPAHIQQVGISNAKKLNKKVQQRKLSDASDDELEKMIEAMGVELKKAQSQTQASRIKNKLGLLEAEQVKRKAEMEAMVNMDAATNPPPAPDLKQQSSDLGSHMALGFLLLGVTGYLVGGFAQKNAWTCGLIGGALGAAGAWGIVQMKNAKDEKAIEAAKTTPTSTSTTAK